MLRVLYNSRGLLKMEESQPSEHKGHPSIMARVQKLRTRMYIEALSGVPATNEDLFLPICMRYEQGLEILFTSQKHHTNDAASQKFWSDWRDRADFDQNHDLAEFDDFSDWYKY
jgi:hypothetical protein